MAFEKEIDEGERKDGSILTACQLSTMRGVEKHRVGTWSMIQASVDLFPAGSMRRTIGVSPPVAMKEQEVRI
jgi:hypothetical protein